MDQPTDVGPRSGPVTLLTPRLRLARMTEEFLEASLEHRDDEAEALSGLEIPSEWFDDKDFIALRLRQYREDPVFARWGVWSVALRATDQMVGSIGFHSPPGPEYLRPLAPGGIEFGYRTFARHRRQGYARESIQALVSWAAREQHVPSFVISVGQTNTASLALAAKLGFEKVGEHQDAINGLEDVLRLQARALVRVVEAGDPATPSPIEEIPNFRRVNERLVTGGQPTEGQLRQLAAEGFNAVINLAMTHDSRYALPDEAALARSLDIDYIHIPVRFDRPTREDLQRFFAAMDRFAEQNLLVHCAMNYRVSAFLGLYRVLRLHWTPAAGFGLMRSVWEPDRVWSTFLNDHLPPVPESTHTETGQPAGTPPRPWA